RSFLRGVQFDDPRDLVEDPTQPLMKARAVENIDGCMIDMPRAPVRIDLDDADAGALAARVDAEDARHWSARSGNRPSRRKATVSAATSLEKASPVCVQGITQCASM